MIGILLQEQGLVPDLPVVPARLLVTVFSAELLPESLTMAAELRSAGLAVACYPEPAKLPRQFKYADRMGMKAVLVLGPDEVAGGKVAVKDLGQGTQQIVERGKVLEAARNILERG